MDFFLVFLLRLLPTALIMLVRQGHVQLWLLAVMIFVTGVIVSVGSHIGDLRGHFYTNEHNPMVANPLRREIAFWANVRIGLVITYGVMLILFALV